MMTPNHRGRAGTTLGWYVIGLGWACLPWASAAAPDLRTLAEQACDGVGRVSHVQDGSQGAPILLAEEIHVSRAAQIENAIALARLHDRYGLLDLAVEGYLSDGPPMELDWLRIAASGLTPGERAEVAGRLLYEGEIGTATALALIYDGLRLHAVEKRIEFDVNLEGEAGSAMTRYLVRIAQRSMRPEHLLRFGQMQQELASAAPDEQPAKARAALAYLMSLDPFTKAKFERFSDAGSLATLSLETILEDCVAIEARAQELAVPLDATDRDAMARSRAFWHGRIAANHTMADSTGRIAERAGTALVALNLGAAHTRGVTDRLSAQGRPFAAIRPAAMDTPGVGVDLDPDSIERLEQRQSLFSAGLAAELLRVYPVDPRGAEPGLNLAWVQAKIELYLFARRLARQVFTDRGDALRAETPSGLGLTADMFRGRRIQMDVPALEFTGDTTPGRAKALLFLVRMQHGAARQDPVVVWVKLGVVPTATSGMPQVATALLQARDLIRSAPRPGRQAEDARGRIHLTRSVRVAFAARREEALGVPVTD